MEKTGVVSWYNSAKGEGVITDDNGKEFFFGFGDLETRVFEIEVRRIRFARHRLAAAPVASARRPQRLVVVAAGSREAGVLGVGHGVAAQRIGRQPHVVARLLVLAG